MSPSHPSYPGPIRTQKETQRAEEEAEEEGRAEEAWRQNKRTPNGGATEKNGRSVHTGSAQKLLPKALLTRSATAEAKDKARQT